MNEPMVNSAGRECPIGNCGGGR